jgi:Flp pilus assembly protein TadD
MVQSIDLLKLALLVSFVGGALSVPRASADPGAGWVPPARTAPPSQPAATQDYVPPGVPAAMPTAPPSASPSAGAPQDYVPPDYNPAGSAQPQWAPTAPPSTPPTASPAPNRLPSGFTRATTPQPSWGILKTARALLLSGRTAEALQLILKFIALQPLEPDGYFWLGLAYDELDQPDLAVAAYRKSLTQASSVGMDSSELHTNLGNTLLKSRHIDEAIAEYQRAIDLEPKATAARMNLARALLAKDQPQQALDALNKCNQAGAPQAQLHYYRAKSLKALGNMAEAQAEARRDLDCVNDAGARTMILREFQLESAP